MFQKGCLAMMLFFCSFCQAQFPVWQWAFNGGGIGHDYGEEIVADANGNIYVTGNFDPPSISFGNITLNTNSPFGPDVFLVKYDSSGNVLWAKKFGGVEQERGYALTIDLLGNIYLTGIFLSPTIIFNNDTLINNGLGDVFIAKYDSSGNELWASSFGGSVSENSFSIGVDVYGRVCITGNYNSPSLTIGSSTLINSGQYDAFIAKFDAVGQPLWAKKVGGAGVEYGYGVASDLFGNVYATGTFWSTSITIDTVTIASAAGGSNLYIVKIDPSGVLLWSKSAGLNSSAQALGSGITIDGIGNTYVTGAIYGTGATFGSFSLSSTGSYNDLLILKYDVFGNVLMAKKFGGINAEAGEQISRDSLGNLYVSGHYQYGTAMFGLISLGNNGHRDGFVAKFDSLGNIMWAEGFGGLEYEYVGGIANDLSGNAYVTGQFRSASMVVDGIILVNAGVNATGDYFIGKLGYMTVGVEEYSSPFSMSVYPNPFSNELKVATDNNEVSEVILYDATSRILMQQQFKNSVSVSTEKLARGFYLYVVHSGNGLYQSGKLFKD